MRFEIPNLDDRRCQDLIDEAKHRLGVHCPEWSDHNVSDPGVMLIELFAHMVDQLNFRLNQVPDKLYLEMLELIGIERFPPTPAQAEITFWLAAPNVVRTVPARTQVATPRRAGAPTVVFTVPDAREIVPCALRGVGTARAGQETEWLDAPPYKGAPVVCFADPPAVGDALCVALDTAVHGCVVRLRFDCDPAFGQGVDPKRPPLAWEAEIPGASLPCDQSQDTTGGLNTSGEVILHVPERVGMGAEAPTVLRCKLVDADVPRYQQSPRVHGIEAHTVGGTTLAYHAEIVENELLGVSDGYPGQRFQLSRAPITSPDGITFESPVIDVIHYGEAEQWTQVANFSQSTDDDHHFTLDAASGEVRFGPAVRHPGSARRRFHGSVPPRGARLVMRRYLTGGGAGGNVGPRELVQLKTNLPFVKRVENRYAATGGTAAESVEEVKVRGPFDLRALDRAVTAEDYEYFVLRDSRVARVRCYAPQDKAGGSSFARLLIVPRLRIDDGRALDLAELLPSPELLEEIRAELEPRRVIGARFEVASPTYIGLRVDARVRLGPGFEPVVVERAAERALTHYFHPTIGGADGQGWPFGGAVYSGMAYLVLQGVAGVELVEDVRLIPVDLETGVRGEHTQGFTLGAEEVVVSHGHAVAATKGSR